MTSDNIEYDLARIKEFMSDDSIDMMRRLQSEMDEKLSQIDDFDPDAEERVLETLDSFLGTIIKKMADAAPQQYAARETIMKAASDWENGIISGDNAMRIIIPFLKSPSFE